MECSGAVRRRDGPIDNEIVELERGWTVRVFDRPFLVAAFAAHSVRYFVAAGVFQKIGWCECWCSRTLYAERTGGRDCDVWQSSYTSDGTDNRELLEERAVGLQSSWVDS